MKRIKLMVLSFLALAFGAPVGFRTANVNDKGVEAGDPTTELLCKGAGVDPKNVYWRVRAGLSPKQAVDVAAQEQFEAQLDKFTQANEKKSDADIRAMAEDAGIEVNPNMSRNQLLIALLRTKQAPAPDSSATTSSSETKPVDEMTVPELKAHAAKRNIDITGLKTKKQIAAAVNKTA